jgi:hypothetical protein
VMVIAAATVAWPHAIEQSEEVPSVLPVELVTIADVTNIAPSVQETQKPETPPEPTPPAPAAAPPPPPQAEVAPPEPDKPTPPKEEVKNASAPPNPVRPRRKPLPDQQKFDVDTVLALLDKRAPKPVAPAPAPVAKPAETTVKGLGAQDAFTMDLKDALLAQMRECWNVPVGAPNPEQLIVQVRVFLAQDGSLAQPPLLEPASRAAAAGNPYMRTAAEAALRAVSVCEPYKRLPPNKYDDWREIVMTFDPSKMAGR